MTFHIPNIADLNEGALRRYRAEAETAFQAAYAAAETAGVERVTAEQLDELEALSAFRVAADERLTTFASNSSRLAQFSATATEPATTTTEPTAVQATPAVTEPPAVAPTVAETAANAPATTASGEQVQIESGVLVAAADVPGFATGEELTDLDAAGRAFAARIRGYDTISSGRVEHGFAVLRRPDAGFTVQGDRGDIAVVDQAASERARFGQSLVDTMQERMEQGASLTAAAGWCAPSETDYTIRTNGQVVAMPSFPTVSAPRGGIVIMPPLEFSDIFGGTTGTSFFGLTEAQVAAGNTKTFIEVGCPTPNAEVRLRVDGFGAVTNLLALRGYPEYSSAVITLSMVGLAHKLAGLQVAAVQSAATAVALTAAAPHSNDGSVYAQLFGAVETAAIDIRYRLRLATNATVEMIFPHWLLGQIRADMRRRAGREELFITDARIMQEFAALGIAPQFVYNYLDAWSGVSGAPGAATPITALPTALEFLAYPAGTWVRAESDVIDLRSVYDATRLAANQRLEVFTESGWAMLKRGSSITRKYTLTICPSGATGAAKTIACS